MVEKYISKIETMLSRLDCSGFAQNFSAYELIAGTGSKFLEIIYMEDDKEGLEKFCTALERELNQDIINELRITSYYAQIIRDSLGLVMFINCGFRPVAWEHYKGRSGGSFHTKGYAFDFTCNNLEAAINFINRAFSKGGRKLYNNFVHFDRRREFATW